MGAATRLLTQYRGTSFTPQDALSEWRGQGGLVFGVRETALVGLARLDKLRCEDWTLSSFVVDPAFRGQGEGQGLLRACLSLLPNESVHLRVRQENGTAYNLYRSFGFRELESTNGRYLMKLNRDHGAEA
jgi:ribosomal protein S18 acetylase RimI-like enzyme